MNQRVLDRPEDLGAKLKASYPDIGWAPDTDGHPTLPFSVGCKLILRAGAERDNRDTLLFAEFPSAQYLNRICYAKLQSLYMTCTYVCNKTAITHLRSVCNRYIVDYTHCNDDLLHMCKVDNSHSV